MGYAELTDYDGLELLGWYPAEAAHKPALPSER